MYNENDPHAAQWLKNLIDHGHIMRGRVDHRSIIDLRANDVRDDAQCHFFAGVGVWSYALQLAGWPASRPVWTGSCPCQPFSTAGKRQGTGDPRHLWPVWFDLIRECGPATIIGEQVASKAALEWFDVVSADLESEGYAVAAADLCAASVGAPHIRQRLFWVANRGGEGWTGRAQQSARQKRQAVERDGHVGGMANTTQQQWDGSRNSGTGWRTELTNGCGDDSEHADLGWLECSDGKYRPTQPGVCPLAHGVAGRMAKLRAIGNAIVAPLAVEFIKTVMEITP